MKRVQIVERNPMVFMYAVQDAIQNGYEIDAAEEFSMFFDLYTIGLVKKLDADEHDAVFVPNVFVTKKQGRPTKASFAEGVLP